MWQTCNQLNLLVLPLIALRSFAIFKISQGLMEVFKLEARKGTVELSTKTITRLFKGARLCRDQLEAEMGEFLIDAIRSAFRSFATFKIGQKFGLKECYDLVYGVVAMLGVPILLLPLFTSPEHPAPLLLQLLQQLASLPFAFLFFDCSLSPPTSLVRQERATKGCPFFHSQLEGKNFLHLLSDLRIRTSFLEIFKRFSPSSSHVREVGHQLITNIGTTNIEKAEASKAMKEAQGYKTKEVFIKGYDLCQLRVAKKFELNLGFLIGEPSKDEAELPTISDNLLGAIAIEKCVLKSII
ncbi:hypothetical protein COCNU_scaffold002988G000010 [Cocos nucifera]|nr:hypothetical protein [Cocos nucifera]